MNKKEVEIVGPYKQINESRDPSFEIDSSDFERKFWFTDNTIRMIY